MPTMKNRGPAGEVRQDSESGVVRNRPGPASDATRKQELAQRLNEREPVPKKESANAASSGKSGNEMMTPMNFGRKLRERKQRMEDIVDDASK